MLFIFTIKYSSQTAYMLFHIGLHLLLWRERERRQGKIQFQHHPVTISYKNDYISGHC